MTTDILLSTERPELMAKLRKRRMKNGARDQHHYYSSNPFSERQFDRNYSEMLYKTNAYDYLLMSDRSVDEFNRLLERKRIALDRPVVEYMVTPSIERAKALLNVLNIQHPLSGLLALAQSSSTSSTSRTIRKRKLSETTSRTSRGGSPIDLVTQISSFAHLDALHDLADLRIPKDDSRRAILSDFIINGTTASFNKQILKERFNRKNNKLTKHILNEAKSFMPAFEPMRGSLSDEIDIFKRFSNETDTLSILIDGLFNDLAFDRAEKDSTLFRDALVHCALLHVLLHNHHTVTMLYRGQTLAMSFLGLPVGVPLKKIRLMHGEFNKIDCIYTLDSFISIWIEAVADSCMPLDGVVEVHVATSAPPLPISRLFNVPITLTDTEITVESRRYQIDTQVTDPTRYNFVNFIQSIPAIMQGILDGFMIPYTSWAFLAFADVFAKSHLDATITAELTQRFTQFFADLIIINTICDLYRIDCALQNDWVYVTADQMAYTAYRAIAIAEGIKHKGILLAANTATGKVTYSTS